MNNLGQPSVDEINTAFCDKCNALLCVGCPVSELQKLAAKDAEIARLKGNKMSYDSLDKLVKRCNDMDITEQINVFNDPILPSKAVEDCRKIAADLAAKDAEIARLQKIEQAAKKAYAAIEQYLSWGPMTQSDRYLCEKDLEKANGILASLLDGDK